MDRLLVALTLGTLLALACSSSRARAQSPVDPSEGREALRAVDAESRTASDVYRVTLGVTLGGVALVGVGLGMMLSDFSLSGRGSGLGLPGLVLACLGGAMGGVGLLILLPVAIGLDVDSGSRRAGLRVTAGPGEMGAGVAIDF